MTTSGTAEMIYITIHRARDCSALALHAGGVRGRLMAIFTRKFEMMEWSDCLYFFAGTQDKGDNRKQGHEQ
jgi:hypothetical protein